MEYKDEYIDHLTFLLNPHLNLLLTDVVAKIRAMLANIGGIITLIDCHAPRLLLILK